jgi:CheY-like chemotaxis protein
MAVVLCVGIHRELIATRRLLLKGAGHTVFTATNEVEVAQAAAEHAFDVVVVGQRIAPPEKRRILLLARQHTPEAKVLELYERVEKRVLTDADDSLLVPTDVPVDLVTRVEALAARQRQAPAPARPAKARRRRR